MTDDKKADVWALFALFLLFLNVLQFLLVKSIFEN